MAEFETTLGMPPAQKRGRRTGFVTRLTNPPNPSEDEWKLIQKTDVGRCVFLKDALLHLETGKNIPTPAETLFGDKVGTGSDRLNEHLRKAGSPYRIARIGRVAPADLFTKQLALINVVKEDAERESGAS